MCRTSNVVCDRSRSCQKFNALRKIASLSRATVKIIKLRGIRSDREIQLASALIASISKHQFAVMRQHQFAKHIATMTCKMPLSTDFLAIRGTKRQNGRHRPRRVSRLYSVEMLEPATSSKRHSEAAGRLHPENRPPQPLRTIQHAAERRTHYGPPTQRPSRIGGRKISVHLPCP